MKTKIVLMIGTALAICVTLDASGQGPDKRFVPPDSETRLRAIGSTKGLSPILQRAFSPNEHQFARIPYPDPSDWLAQHSETGQTFQQYLQSRPNRPGRQRGTIYFQPLGKFPEPSRTAVQDPDQPSRTAVQDPDQPSRTAVQDPDQPSRTAVQDPDQISRTAVQDPDQKQTGGPNLTRLSEFASAFFMLPVVIKKPIAIQGTSITTRRRESGSTQLLSTDVLDWLKSRVPDDAYCLLAITMSDLYPDPKWNFVFGQASLRDRVGVYSFARYAPEFYGQRSGPDSQKLILQRSCKVLAHETGHMFGIKHCIHFHCLMNGSNHLEESDAQPIHLCPVCLRKLHAASEFDVVKRYDMLRVFSAKVGWSDESKWLADRRVVLDPKETDRRETFQRP